ncbi:MAG: hypothetical protein K0R55_1506 [Sporomusa sp.]|jgi:hypothetical protein|nr:hypothetical protein [Sporomusa sp.]
MKIVTLNGLYFSGKVKDLLKELSKLSKEYVRLRDIVNKNVH